MNKISPMMQQYLSIKDQHPDKILFFQVGDFYETFWEDARTVSRELELVLTSRDSSKSDGIPLAGMPVHAASNYMARLLEKGYKVVICDQVEDASQAKGLVKREITRIITPGTVTDLNMLEENRNNYLLSLHKEEGPNEYGMAVVDVSTGGFWATEICGDGCMDMIKTEWQRLRPSECIVTRDLKKELSIMEVCNNFENTLLEEVPADWFQVRNAAAEIGNQWGEEQLKLLELERNPLAVQASGALIAYLKNLQRSDLKHLKPVELYSPGQYLLFDGVTRRNLELTHTIREGKKKGSLLWVLNHTCSSMGERMLKRWIEQPLRELDKINSRIDAVEEFYQTVELKDEMRSLLRKVYDLERLCSRINFGNVDARDLVALKNSLVLLPRITKLLDGARSALLKEIRISFPNLSGLAQLISDTLVDEPPSGLRDGGFIRGGFDPEVDRLRLICSDGKQWLLNFEKEEKERTGIKSLKVGYNRVFGYYIEITRTYLHMVPPGYHRKQTLVNAERYINERLKEMEGEITGAGEKLAHLEFNLFEELREKTLTLCPSIQLAAQLLAELDCLQSLGEAALLNRYNRPSLSRDNPLSIKEGRHPVVEKTGLDERFVPNDALLDREHPLLIITGPNMAGKSTYCRSIALICLMAQMGGFVPAGSAILPVLDRIFARVGASDDLSSGQSTFMVEMNETASILKEATRDTLIVMDEIGRGTSTYDGMSIARSVLEYIQGYIKAWTLFSTHYHELTVMENELTGIKNCTMAVKEKDGHVIFLRKVTPGKADRSYGINVARLAGLPSRVIFRAEELLRETEKKGYMRSMERPGQLSLIAYPPDLKSRQDDGKETLIIKKIKELDPLQMTPLEALQKIFQLQSLLNSDGENAAAGERRNP